MHIYSVLDKLFTPKVEQNKVQDNTNEQKKNFQVEKEEKIIPNESVAKTQEQTTNKNKGAAARLETCYVSFPKNGDTIAVLYNKQQTTFRLAGINAYEKGVRWNKQAVKYLVEQIGKKPVFIDVLDKDSDGNTKVEIYLDKEKTLHINKMLLEQDFPMDVKPKIEESLKKPEKIEDVIQQANEEILESKVKSENKVVEDVIEKANQEALDTQPKNKIIEENSLWTGIPEDIEGMPMAMPDDDYFWQSQMDGNNLDFNTTISNDNFVSDQNTNIEFNPFVDPPIEPLSVYPNGVKPILSNNDVSAEDSIVSGNLNNEVRNEPILVEQNTNVEFNPFVDPPIEPLSVYPNGIKPDLQDEISSLEKLEQIQVNLLSHEVPELLTEIDTIVEDVKSPIAQQVVEPNTNSQETQLSSKQDLDIKTQTKINNDNEGGNKKVVLKFGLKGKTNSNRPKDDIEAALDINEEKNFPTSPKDAEQALTTLKSSEVLQTNKNESEAQKEKLMSSLPPECNPFLDVEPELESSNVDALTMLENYDSLGDIVSGETENSKPKPKKLGR
jgi:hypothetical protein